MKKPRRGTRAAVVLSLALCAFGGALLATVDALRSHSLEMLLFNLRMTQKQNANFSAMNRVFLACGKAAAIALLAASLAWLFYFRVLRKTRAEKAVRAALQTGSCLFFAACLALSPLTRQVPGFVLNQIVSTPLYEARYVDPSAQNVTFPEGRRNLIHILVESMETTLADTASGGECPENFIPNLTRMATENPSFRGWETVTGADWTVAGHVAQTSGLPVRVDLFGNPFAKGAAFFPNVTTLGDLLKDAGYQQLYLCGSDADFGYRADYFVPHGYAVWDLKSAKAEGRLPQSYNAFWGFEDEKLYAYAREKLTQLAAGDAPFNLTLLTVDTHFYGGYVCRLCEDRYPSRYQNVVACADRQLAAFVDWIKAQDFYAHTTVVISGDHLCMDDGFYLEMGIDRSDRHVYLCVLNPADGLEAPARDQAFTAMDVFPTVLRALGAKWDSHRLGLGVDLFSGEETLAQSMGIDGLNAALARRSAFYDGLVYQ